MQLGKMFKEAVRDLVRWANSHDQDSYESPSPAPGKAISRHSGTSSVSNSEREMHFTVTGANGGKIVKVHWYDDKVGREYVNLHIITDQEDLSEELAQIITRESLQR